MTASTTARTLQMFVRSSIAKWAAASDETQEVAIALMRSKDIISMFSNTVAAGEYVSC